MNTIDVSPLAVPVNACRWNAAQLRHQAKSMQMPDAQRAQLERSCVWLEELGKHVPFVHTNPVLLVAIGNLALNAKDRDAFVAALQQITEVTERATGAAQAANGAAGGGGWVEVK